ncbi:RDD domain-containing protein [Pseudomonas sp. IT-P253]|jgi:hypothetical protein|uniref:hypothetical protein n=1 Tax=Pseudomonas sp. IT-P253 TaxID=3026455 RepID=UPI0039E0DA44
MGKSRHFYADCVIDNITNEKIATNGKEVVVTAWIDGRELQKLRMNGEMYRYFTGIGKGTKNRIWFCTYTRKDPLMIAAVENAAGELLKTPTFSKKTKFFDFVIRSVCLGGVVWFAAWVILFIPVAFVTSADFDATYNFINPTGIYAGIFVGLRDALWSRKHMKKLERIDTWEAGDFNHVPAVQPKFGDGLAAMKK